MLISEIINELITETGGDTSNTDLAALWLIFLKGAFRRLPVNVRHRSIVATYTDTLSAGNNSLSLQSNFVGLRNNEVYRVNGNYRLPISVLPPSEFNKFYRDASGTPSYCRVIDKTLYFEISAIEDYSIFYEYFKDVSDGLASTDTFFGTTELLESIKDMAKFTHYHDYEEDESKGSTHMGLARDQLDKIDAQYMDETFGGHVDDE